MEAEIKETLKKLLICAYVIIALLAINTIIMFISNVEVTKDSNTKTEQTEENTEYDVSMFEKIDFEGVKSAFDSKDTQVIYVGRSTCGYCVQFLPALQQAQEEFGYKTKYYDIGDVTQESLQSNREELAKYDDDDKFIDTNLGATPMILLVRNGKLVKGWVGYAEYEEFEKFLIENGFEK